jgi:predicted signal transduction protein with EAL and GGDEF domain
VELARARNRGHRVLLAEIEIPGLAALEAGLVEPPDLGAILRVSLREFDLVARVGEDRFAALVPEPDEETRALLARLCRVLRQPLDRELAPTPCPVVRMGYAVFPEDGGDLEALETRAAEPRVEAS